jgi:hypothetical protein
MVTTVCQGARLAAEHLRPGPCGLRPAVQPRGRALARQVRVETPPPPFISSSLLPLPCGPALPSPSLSPPLFTPLLLSLSPLLLLPLRSVISVLSCIPKHHWPPKTDSPRTHVKPVSAGIADYNQEHRRRKHRGLAAARGGGLALSSLGPPSRGAWAADREWYFCVQIFDLHLHVDHFRKFVVHGRRLVVAFDCPSHFTIV